MTLSKMNAEINSSIQSLIETNELQSVLGGSNETYVVEESTAHQAAKQDSACYRAIIPPVKQRQAVYGTETKDTLSVPLNTRVRDKKRLEKVGNLVKNSYLYR